MCDSEAEAWSPPVVYDYKVGDPLDFEQLQRELTAPPTENLEKGMYCYCPYCIHRTSAPFDWQSFCYQQRPPFQFGPHPPFAPYHHHHQHVPFVPNAPPPPQSYYWTPVPPPPGFGFPHGFQQNQFNADNECPPPPPPSFAPAPHAYFAQQPPDYSHSFNFPQNPPQHPPQGPPQYQQQYAHNEEQIHAEGENMYFPHEQEQNINGNEIVNDDYDQEENLYDEYQEHEIAFPFSLQSHGPNGPPMAEEIVDDSAAPGPQPPAVLPTPSGCDILPRVQALAIQQYEKDLQPTIHEAVLAAPLQVQTPEQRESTSAERRLPPIETLLRGDYTTQQVSNDAPPSFYEVSRQFARAGNPANDDDETQEPPIRRRRSDSYSASSDNSSKTYSSSADDERETTESSESEEEEEEEEVDMTTPIRDDENIFDLSPSELDYIQAAADGENTEGLLDSLLEYMEDLHRSPLNNLGQTGGGGASTEQNSVPRGDLQRLNSRYSKLCYIEHDQPKVTQRANGIVTSIDVTTLFLRKIESGRNMTAVFPQLFDEFVSAVLRANGLNPRTERFCLIVRHPCLRERPIFLNFQTTTTVNGVAVMNLIEKYKQSNATLSLSSPLSLTIHVHNRQPSDGNGKEKGQEKEICGAGGSARYFDRELRIKKIIRGSGRHCLARSFIVAKAKADVRFLESGAFVPASELFAARQTLRRLKRSPAKQKMDARALLEECGIDVDKSEYSLEDLRVIAEKYDSYCIKVFVRPPGHHRYSVTPGGLFNPGAHRFVTIGHHANHFEPFEPGKDALGGTICNKCGGVYKRRDQHRCRRSCTKCKTKDCGSGEAEQRRCSDCNVVFVDDICFNLHKMSLRAGNTVCNTYKVCLDCNAYYRVKRTRPHRCNTKFCTMCKQHVSIDEHLCCWQPPSTQKREKAAGKQEKYKIVVYDFETVLNVDQAEQYVNVAAYSMYCNLCRDQPLSDFCENCPQKQGYFKYTSQQGEPESYTVDRFLDFLLFDPSCSDALVIAHNASRFDAHFLLRRLYERGYKPNCIADGCKLIGMNLDGKKRRSLPVDQVGPPPNSLKFRDSFLLIPTALSNLPEAFGFEDQCKGYFPYYANKPANYGKVLPKLPDKRQYGCNEMVDSKRKKFLEWYRQHKRDPFDFDAEIVRYCLNDVLILRTALIAYSSAYLRLTSWDPVIQCMTYASFSMHLLKMEALLPDQLGVIPEQGFDNGDRQSVLALKYLKWLEETTGQRFQSKLSQEGEYRISSNGHHYRVDGYVDSTNTVIEVHGCFYHGCPKCNNPATRHPLKNKSMAEVYQDTLDRTAAIRDAGYTVEEVFEHDIRGKLAENEEMRKFFDSFELLEPLRPREAFMGGRTQCYRVFAKKNAEKGEKILYRDYNSLYPYVVSRVAAYPKGQPTVIRENFQMPTVCGNFPYRGLIKCVVLAPRDCLFPVIGVHMRQKLIYANCRTCAEEQITLPCTHSRPEDRAFTVTVCDVELRKALQIGYRVLKMYEVWHWPDNEWEIGLMFRQITDKMYAIKTCASGWPRDVTTPDQRDAYMERLSSTLGIDLRQFSLETGIEIAKNGPLRTVAKLVLNRQRPDKSSIHFVDCGSAEFAHIISDSAIELTNIDFVTRDMALIVSKPRMELLTPTPYTNVVYAAITTATARLLLWELMNKLGDKVLYVDTDSVIYIHKEGDEDIGLGDQMGQLTDELPPGFEIDEFVSIAPKVYSYTMTNAATGEQRAEMRTKGFTLDHNAAKRITHSKMKELALSLSTDATSERVSTSRVNFVKCLGRVSAVTQTKQLRAVMDKVVLRNDYTTRPFGYLENAEEQPAVAEFNLNADGQIELRVPEGAVEFRLGEGGQMELRLLNAVEAQGIQDSPDIFSDTSNPQANEDPMEE